MSRTKPSIYDKWKTSNRMTLFSINGGAGATAIDTRGFIPANRILNTITWWTSDYFAFGSLFVQDFISAGHTFLPDFTPTLTITGYGTSNANFTVASSGDSGNKLAFNVSQVLLTINKQSYGAVVGANTITINFYSLMNYSYTNPYTDASALKQGDLLHNNATLTAAVRNFTHPNISTGYSQAPFVQSNIIVSIDQYSFSVVTHAVNHTLCNPYPCVNDVVSPGTVVTLRVRYHLPITTFRDLSLVVHLQAPLFDATQLNAWCTGCDSSSPVLGSVQWGPNDSTTLQPTFTTDAHTNYVTFSYGTHVDHSLPSTYIDLLLTFSITFAVYKDNSLFTSVGVSSEGYLPYTSSSQTAVTVVEPFLQLSTGFVATNSPYAVFSNPALPVSFASSSCPRYSSAITTNLIAATPINSNLLDADDTATFAIVVVNAGHSKAYNVSINSNLTGRIITTQGLNNLCVRYGNQAAARYSVAYSGDTGLTFSLEDPIPGDGTLSASATDGANILIITFDIDTEMDFVDYTTHTAGASLCNYASGPAGPNFASGCVFANSTMTPAVLSASHALWSTSLSTDIASPNVVAGEQATYNVSLTFPEGTGNFTFLYTVADPKVMLVSVTPSLGANILPSTWTVSLLDQNANGITETASLSVVVTDTPDNVQSSSDVVNLVVVTQIIYNTTSQGSSTSLAAYAPVAAVSFGITNLTLTATPALTLLVPSLSLTLAVSTTTVEAKQLVHVTITVSASSSPTPGYDIDVTSLIPPQLHVVANTLSITGSGQGQTIFNGNAADSANVSAEFVKLPKSGSITIQFDTTVDSEVLSGTTITLSSNLAYCSSPAAYGRGCYTTSQTKILNVSPPSVGLSVYNTSLIETLGNNAAIGERVVYHANLTYPKGNAFNGVFTISLPTTAAQQIVLSNSVIFIGANFNITSLPAGVQSTSSVQYSIPSLRNDPDAVNTNGNVIIFEITALVTNSSSNVNAATNPTTALLTYYGSPYSASTSIKVVLPALSITKSHSTATSYVDAYTVVNYTLTIAHAGSTSPAYNTTINDLLPNTLTLDAGSVQVSVGASVTTTSNSLQVTIGTFLLSAPAIVVTYSATVQPNVLASQYIVNNANATYNSAPPDSYNTGNIRSYAIYTSHSVAVAAPTVTFKLGLLSTSLTETIDPNVAIGETVTIPIEIGIPRGVTKNAVVNVTLPTTPGKLKAIVGDVVVIPPYTTSLLSQGDASVNSDASGDGIKDVFTFNFGDIVDNPSGATNNTITLLVTMVVSADGTTNNGDVLVSTAAITYYNGTNTLTQSATFSVTVVEPLLALSGYSTTTYTSHIGSGTIVKYTLTLSNVPGATGSTGPSYYVEIYDGLDPRLSLIYGTVSTTSGNVTQGNNPGDTVVRVRPATILPTQTVTITFNATLLDSVEASTTVYTNATYQYSSSWYQTYNSDDVRNRSGYTTLNVTATSPKVAFVLNYTTIPETLGSTVTIGEAASIVTTLSVPKGSTNNALLTLAVPKTTVKMQMMYARVAFLEPSLGITAYTVGQYVPLSNTNTDTYNDTAALNFGAIFNPSGGVEFSTPTVAAIVEFIGLVLDIPANINNSALPSTMNFGYGSSVHYTLPTQYVTLTEALPSLKIVKTAALPSNYLEAGSSVQYTVVVSHAAGSASPAFNISVIDPLTPNHKLQTATVTTSTGTVVVGTSSSDTFISVAPATLAVGSSVTITYNTTFADTLPPNTPIVNTVNATYYSAPPGTWNSGNIHNATVFTSATVATAAPTVVLSLSATSLPQTPGSNVTIGETITFLATVQIPHGVTQGATLNISLPTSAGKLGVISANISSMSTYLTSSLSRSKGYTATPIDSNGDGVLDVVSISFGTLYSPFDGTFKSSNGTIVVQIQALVVNSVLNTNLALLTTSASFYYSNGTNTFQAGPSNVGVTVVLPSLSLVMTASAPSYTEAGSVIVYTLTIRHNVTVSTSPAFNLSVVDLLSSPYLSLNSGSVKVSAGSIVTGNSVSDTTIYIVPPTMLLTDVITVTYNATLNPTTITGSSVPNTATVSYASAFNTPDNNNGKDVYFGSASGSAKVVVSSPSLAFAVNAVSLSEIVTPNVSIGETVTLRATIVVPAGYTDLSSLKVTLPNLPNGQLSAVYGSVVSVPAAINATYTSGTTVAPTQHAGFNDTVTFSFGTFSNPHDAVTQGPSDTIIVDILALVVNSSANTGGVLTTSASFSYFNGASAISIPKSVTLTVVLPQLSISKDAVVPAYLQAGDVIQYTVTVSHTGSSASPAYTVLVTDLLSASLKLVAGSVTSSKGGVVTGNNATDTTVVVDPSVFLTTGGPLVITYSATLTSAAETATFVHNSASATYYSSSSNPYNNNNIRIATISTDNSVLLASPNLTFVLTNTSLTETTGSNVAIGETATYTASILLPHGTTNNVEVVVTLPVAPGKLQVVSSKVSYLTANAQSSTLSLGASGVASDSNSDGFNDTVTFNLGTVVSAPSPLADTNRVDVQVVAVVPNIAANVAGTVLSSNAVLTYGESGAHVNPPAVSVVIVEPKLGASQNCTPTSGESGDVITCVLSVTHLAALPAYQVTFANTFSAGTFKLVAGSVTTTLGSVVTGNTAGDLTFSVVSGVVLSSDTFTVTYQATLTDQVVSSSTVTVNSTLSYQTAPTNFRSASVAVWSAVAISPATLVVSIESTSVASTVGNDVTIGESVSFLATITLARGVTTVPVLTITTGSALSILQAQVVTLGNSAACATAPTGVLTGTSSVVFDFGAKLCDSSAGSLGDDVVVRVTTVVSNITTNANGASLPVQATLTYGPGVTLTDSESVSVVEPNLVLSKTSDVAVVGGDQFTNITYTVTIVHSGSSSSDAYELNLSDTIPDTLALVQGSVTISSGQVSINGGVITASLASVPTGTTVTLTYVTSLVSTVLSGSVIINTASLHYVSAPNSSVPFAGAARAYSTNTSAQVYVGDPILESFIVYSKTLDSKDPDFASAPPTYYFTVGEVVTFHLVASLPDEPNPFINLAQRIPFSSFTVLNVSAVLGATVSAGSSATNLVNGNMVWYNFTSVTNAAVGDNEEGTITLVVQVVVNDVSDNQYPATFTTTGSLFSAYANSSRDIKLSIVEPSLIVTTTVTPVNVQAGDVVTYTTTISHAASSTTIAYLVNVGDFGSDSVLLVAGTVATSVGTVVSGNNPGESVAIQLPQLGLQSTITVTYNATILVPAILSSVHTNNVTVDYQSAPSTSLNVGNVRYFEQTPAAAAVTLLPPSFDLELGSTSNPEVSGNLVLIGENATFVVTVDVPYGTLLQPTLSLSVGINSTSYLILLSSASRIVNTTSTFNTSNSLSNVTSNYGYSSVVSQIGGSKKMVFSFDSVVLPTTVTAGTNLTVASQLTYSNSSYNFTLPTQTSTIVVGIAKFGFVQTCTPTKLHIFSTATCTLTVYPIVQLPAYNLTINNAKLQYFNLNNDSVVSSHGSVAYDSNGGFAVHVPVYNPRNNTNITIVYTLNAVVNTNSDVLVPAYLAYLSSPTIYAAHTAQNASSVVTIKANGGGMNGGVIAGIVLGSIGGAAILGAAAFALFKKKMIPMHNPFARTASLNPSAVVEDNPIYGGDQFANVNNPLYQNTSL